MERTYKEFEEAMNEVMSVCKAQLADLMFDGDMDEQAIAMLRAGFKLIDASKNLMKKQAETMDEMNEKLDKLLDRRDLA